jgi:membrane-bound inhibitor of C-type lysozyme
LQRSRAPPKVEKRKHLDETKSHKDADIESTGCYANQGRGVMESMDRFLKITQVSVRAFLTAAFVTSMLGCSQANVKAEQKWLSFRCPDGQTVMARFEPQDQFVNVRFAGRELRLPHVISGSGARYSDGKTTFWNRGRSVLMQIDDRIVVQDCLLQ